MCEKTLNILDITQKIELFLCLPKNLRLAHYLSMMNDTATTPSRRLILCLFSPRVRKTYGRMITVKDQMPMQTRRNII